MTDYLELLLEIQEQDEEGQTPEGKRPEDSNLNRNVRRHRRMFGKERNVDGGSGVGSERVNQETSDGTEEVAVTRQPAADHTWGIFESGRNRQAAAAQKNTLAAQPLLTEILRLHRAVRQADARIGLQTSSEMQAAFGVTNGAWGESPASSKRINYAALVDMAFARDARRYDGPLGLL